MPLHNPNPSLIVDSLFLFPRLCRFISCGYWTVGSSFLVTEDGGRVVDALEMASLILGGMFDELALICWTGDDLVTDWSQELIVLTESYCGGD